jgi:hypothetical protein
MLHRALSHCGTESVVSGRKYAGWLAAKTELYSTPLSGCDDFLPCLKSTLPFRSVVRSRKEMPFRSEMGSEYIVSLKKTLRMLRRLEALHPALSLAGWLMRVLRAVVHVSALPMGHSRRDDFLGRAIAAKFVGDDHAGRPAGGAQQLAQKANSGKTVAPRLHQDVNDVTLLVDFTPEIMLHSFDL